MKIHPDSEWLETNGLGGYASGTVSGIQTRKYHSMYTHALSPPTQRAVFLHGLDVEVTIDDTVYSLIPHQFEHGYKTTDPKVVLEDFSSDPWPTWKFTVNNQATIQMELLLVHKSPTSIIRFCIADTELNCAISVRPFVSGRDHHQVQKKDENLYCSATVSNQEVLFQGNQHLERIAMLSTATYHHHPIWYENFEYSEEKNRGYKYIEDLLCPGLFETKQTSKGCDILITTKENAELLRSKTTDVSACIDQLVKTETQRRKSFSSKTEKSADQFLVESNNNAYSIIAGYPWFTDWGRDTFIAMRGICFSQKKYKEAKSILMNWASKIDNGMLPNRFIDDDSSAEFNSVDASLWYCIVTYEFLQNAPKDLADDQTEFVLKQTVFNIINSYKNGTRYGIQMDEDGLISCGEFGVQLTWMDAKIDDLVVTPRIGKPVEIQCLWINALHIACEWDITWKKDLVFAKDQFVRKFWNTTEQCLYDCIDVNFDENEKDPSIRPNQIFAIGGLPFQICTGEHAEEILQAVTNHLYTLMGLRSLSYLDPQYKGSYFGDQRNRDMAYHQGTVWPWLLGAYTEAVIRIHKNTHRDLVDQLMDNLEKNKHFQQSGHIYEIADGDAPHLERGCPFQAWSLAEFIRIQSILAP